MTAAEIAADVARTTPPGWSRTAPDTRRGGPVVVERAVVTTEGTWSPEHLARTFGDLEVSVRRRRHRPGDPAGTTRVHVDRAALGAMVASMHADGVYFAPAIPFDRLPGLLGRLDLGPLFPTAADWTAATDYTRLHLGDSMRMRLHWEPTDLFLVQLYGRTRVVIEPPDSTAAHYPCVGWPTASRVEFDDPRHDLDFPLHRGQSRLGTVLLPGDVLHVPRGWWYEARALGRVVWATVAHGPVLPLTDEVRRRLLTLAGRTT
ncbi:hypothetical protein DMP17_44400 [Pseudonocardia sp. TMWB2A]|uniref:cupin-like domain-containing protein n=1 Tax=Pseudonocardia sp. TMWB2A TaxID=687430 RepID=UPI00307EEBA3